MAKPDEKEELLKNIRKASLSDGYASLDEEENQDKKTGVSVETPQEKLDKIFDELRKIKESRVEDYFIRDSLTQDEDEALQEVFNKSVEQILDKPENKKEIGLIFKEFNFDLVKAIVRTIFEAEAEPRILPSASDRAEEAQTRILPLAIQNCPDY